MFEEEQLKLPGQVKFGIDCAARIREIKAIETQLGQCEHGLRAFQKLPRNMQRRSVSGNPQRLPRYLREKHKREVGSKMKCSKRPNRKYRRRPSNLLAEYNRRQRSQTWLETHLWHAKRFHMSERWGYKLPETPTNKSFRTMIRAATETCLLQDVSYECCFEIVGPPTQIKTSLTPLLSTRDLARLQECRLGEMKWIPLTLYKENRCPYEVIGDAQLLWISNTSDESNHKLWLWVHPAIYKETLSTLIQTFHLEKNGSEDLKMATSDYENPVTQTITANRNVPFERTTKYVSKHTTLIDLKDTLVKFRLIGPESLSLLKEVLYPSEVEVITETPKDEKRLWWTQFYSKDENVKTNNIQLAQWKTLQESDTRRVLGLVIRDPRCVLPSKKQPFPYEEDKKNDVGSPEHEMENDTEISLLPIFDSQIRDAVTMSIEATHRINDKRANMLVPGLSLPLTKEESKIPVLLLQRPASHLSGFGYGWDIVMPCGWGAFTLVSFALNGVAVGGQKEARTLKGEFLIPPDPYQLPDTYAGRLEAEFERREKQTQYFKRPSNCRPNFIKLGVQYPFSCNWMQLVKHWNSSCKDFYILRDEKYLKWLSLKSCPKIGKLISGDSSKCNKRKLNNNYSPLQKVMKKDTAYTYFGTPVIKDSSGLLDELKGSLLYIRLVLIGKGTLEPCAMICMPTEEDLDTFESKGCCDLVEPLHPDVNARRRAERKAEHTKNLKYLRKKRRKAKTDVLCAEEPPDKHSSIREAIEAAVSDVSVRNKDIVASTQSFETEMEELWLSNPEEGELQIGIRNVIGYLTHGGFCTRMGRPGGLGYIASEPLLKYLIQLKLLQPEDTSDTAPSSNGYASKHKPILVLVRNPSNLMYKWARLVILNIWP